MEKEDDRVTLLTSKQRSSVFLLLVYVYCFWPLISVFLLLGCQESIQKVIAIILSYLDHDSLRNAQKVCNAWRIVVREEKLWEKFYYRNASFYKFLKGSITRIHCKGMISTSRVLHLSGRKCSKY